MSYEKDKNKADQLPKQKYKTLRTRGKKISRNKVAQIHYVAVDNFKMEGGVQGLGLASLGTRTQVIRTPPQHMGTNQFLGCRSADSFPKLLTNLTTQIRD